VTGYTQNGQRVRVERLLEGGAVAPCLLVTDRTLHLRMPMGASAVQQAQEAWPRKNAAADAAAPASGGLGRHGKLGGLEYESGRVQAYL
jgi:hypothetical protein